MIKKYKRANWNIAKEKNEQAARYVLATLQNINNNIFHNKQAQRRTKGKSIAKVLMEVPIIQKGILLGATHLWFWNMLDVYYTSRDSGNTEGVTLFRYVPTRSYEYPVLVIDVTGTGNKPLEIVRSLY